MSLEMDFLTTKQLNQAQWQEVQTFFLNFPLFIASLILPLSQTRVIRSTTEGVECEKPIMPWLYVMSAIHLMQSVKAVISGAIILRDVRLRLQRPKFNLFFLLTVTLFEFIWLIYGNTFHYNSRSLECRNSCTQTLWILMMIELALGYIVFLTSTLTSVGGTLYMFLMIRRRRLALQQLIAMGRVDPEHRPPRDLYLEAVKKLNVKSFQSLNQVQRDIEECIICMTEFKARDQVAQLDCDERHYFHRKCAEDWLKQKLQCPLCKKPIFENHSDNAV